MRAIRQTPAQVGCVFALLSIGWRFGAGFKTNRNKNGSLQVEDFIEMRFILARVVEMKRVGKTTRERDFVKIHRARAGNVLVACDFVRIVLCDE